MRSLSCSEKESSVRFDEKKGKKRAGTNEGEDHDRVRDGTETGDLKGLEGESLLTLELVQQLETLETGRLLEVGRDFTSLSSGTCEGKLGVNTSFLRCRSTTQRVPSSRRAIRAGPRRWDREEEGRTDPG
jgi:hypothetical protein